MSRIQRHALAYAKPGQADRLAEILTAVADGLRNSPGCERYIVARVKDDPDAVAVSEQWRSEDDMQAALAAATGSPQMAEALDLLDSERGGGPVDMTPLGGVGLIESPGSGYAHRAVMDVEDVAPKFGMDAMGSCRTVGRELGFTQLGAQHYIVPPGVRQLFGHRHANAEELYVVLAGSGLVALDDDVRPLAAGDVLRVDPPVTRAFEAGPDGLTFIAVGAKHEGDGELLDGWWPA